MIGGSFDFAYGLEFMFFLVDVCIGGRAPLLGAMMSYGQKKLIVCFF